MNAATRAIFFCSGAAALLFETLWFRQAGLVLGNTVWASALVTAAFMAGLALGNLFAVRLGWRLKEEFYSKDEALKMFNLSRLPEDAGEKVRVIKIGEYDACPCSGLHVTHTKEIGVFNIISTDHKDGVLRIRFKLPDD